MKSLFKTSLILIALCSLFLGCKKYPEDPFISFRRPYKRIAGTWNITSYQIWGKEHSHDFDSLLRPRTLTDCCIHFTPYDRLDKGDFTFVDKNNIALFSHGEYGFEDFSNMLDFGMPDTTVFNKMFFQTHTYPSVSYFLSSNNWYIVELYGKHFHISKDGIDIYLKKQ